jgi:hypothetical protein
VTDTDNDPRAQHRNSIQKPSNAMTTHDASSRRSFLASAAGLGIAGIASGALAGRALAQAGTATPPVGAPAAKPSPMIVG